MAGGFGQFQATPSTGFAPFPAASAPVSTVAGQPFGVQNGGFGTTVAQSQAGFAVAPGYATAPGQFPGQGAVLPPAGSQFVAKMGPAAVAAPVGQTQQQFASWGQSPTSNPFMVG